MVLRKSGIPQRHISLAFLIAHKVDGLGLNSRRCLLAFYGFRTSNKVLILEGL